MALTKLLENALDESSKLKNMSDETWGCLTTSLLSQNFYRTMSDLLKTPISHPVFIFLVFNIFCFQFLFADKFHNNCFLFFSSFIFCKVKVLIKNRSRLTVTFVSALNCVCVIKISLKI